MVREIAAGASLSDLGFAGWQQPPSLLELPQALAPSFVAPVPDHRPATSPAHTPVDCPSQVSVGVVASQLFLSKTEILQM